MYLARVRHPHAYTTHNTAARCSAVTCKCGRPHRRVRPRARPHPAPTVTACRCLATTVAWTFFAALSGVALWITTASPTSLRYAAAPRKAAAPRRAPATGGVSSRPPYCPLCLTRGHPASYSVSWTHACARGASLPPRAPLYRNAAAAQDGAAAAHRGSPRLHPSRPPMRIMATHVLTWSPQIECSDFVSFSGETLWGPGSWQCASSRTWESVWPQTATAPSRASSFTVCSGSECRSLLLKCPDSAADHWILCSRGGPGLHGRYGMADGAGVMHPQLRVHQE